MPTAPLPAYTARNRTARERLRSSFVLLGCLLLAFFGLTRVVFGVLDGRPRTASKAMGKRFVETAGVLLPPLLLLVLSLWLGLFSPAILHDAWAAAAAQLFPASP